MNLGSRIALLSAVFLSCAPAAALAAPAAPLGAYVRAELGFVRASLADVNDDIDEFGSILQGISFSQDWERLRGGAQFVGEAGFRFTPAFSLGLALAYQQASVDHTADVGFVVPPDVVTGMVAETVETRLVSLCLAPTLWMSQSPGLHLGALVGVGWGGFDRSGDLDLASTSGAFSVLHTDEEYRQTAFVAGLFGGFDAPMSPALSLSLRLGYQFANFDKMEGTITNSGADDTGPIFESGTSTLTDLNGAPMDVNFSGPHVRIGVAFHLGSGR